MVLYETGSNAMLVEGLRNRTSGEMVVTYQSLVDRLHESKIEPKMHILDNEISQEFTVEGTFQDGDVVSHCRFS